MVQKPLVGQDHLIIEASRSHSDTPVSRTPLDEWSARYRDFYLTTHNTHEPNIYDHGGNRTHNLSKRAASDPRLRPRGIILNIPACNPLPFQCKNFCGW